MSTNFDLLWVGTAEVVPKEGSDVLDDALGAYVGVAGKASSQDEFASAALRVLGELGLELVALDDIYEISLTDLEKLDPLLLEQIPLLANDGSVAFGRFHAYS